MIEIPSREELINSCEKRMSVKELAKKYFVSTTTIAVWLRFYSIKKVGRGFERERLEKLINTDLNKNEIAEELGCSVITLNAYLKKYGLQRVAK